MHYNITYGSIISTATVVSLELAKLNSKIIWDDEDTLLQLFLDASIQDAENYIDGPILKKTITIGLSEWVTNFEFPIFPISSVTSISYVDQDGETQTVDNADYLFYKQEKTSKIKFTADSFPELNAIADFPITLNVVGGYENEDVPSSIKNAVLLRFSHRHMFREDVPTSLNRTFYSALRPYRRY